MRKDGQDVSHVGSGGADMRIEKDTHHAASGDLDEHLCRTREGLVRRADLEGRPSLDESGYLHRFGHGWGQFWNHTRLTPEQGYLDEPVEPDQGRVRTVEEEERTRARGLWWSEVNESVCVVVPTLVSI